MYTCMYKYKYIFGGWYLIGTITSIRSKGIDSGLSGSGCAFFKFDSKFEAKDTTNALLRLFIDQIFGLTKIRIRNGCRYGLALIHASIQIFSLRVNMRRCTQARQTYMSSNAKVVPGARWHVCHSKWCECPLTCLSNSIYIDIYVYICIHMTCLSNIIYIGMYVHIHIYTNTHTNIYI